MAINISELQAKQAEAMTKAETIQEMVVKSGLDMTEDQKTSYDGAMAEAERLQEAIDRETKALEMKARFARPVNPAAAAGAQDSALTAEGDDTDVKSLNLSGARGTLPAQAKVDLTVSQKADALGGLCLAMARCGSPYEVKQYLEAQKGNDAAALTLKILNSGTASAGGVTVPVNLSGEMIGLLHPASVVRQAGPRLMNLPNGNTTISALTTGATAAYTGEATLIAASQPTFGSIELKGRKIAGTVVITSEMMNRSIFDFEQTVRDDLIRALAEKSDLAFLLGDGTGATPTGLAARADAANLLNANATVNLQNITTDLMRLPNALVTANVTAGKMAYFLNPRVKHYLMTLRDGNGNLAFKDELKDGMLNGFPVFSTTQIPTNYAGSSTKIIFAAMDDVIIAEEQALNIRVTRDAVVDMGGGVTVNTFQQDAVGVVATMSHDINVRHAQSVAVLSGVTWMLA